MEGTAKKRWDELSVLIMVVVYFNFFVFVFLQMFKYIYWTAGVFTHCWSQPQTFKKKKEINNRFQSFRSKPAAKPRRECNAAAKLCLCCEECTPLPEFASSGRTDHPSCPVLPRDRGGGCWLLTTNTPTTA